MRAFSGLLLALCLVAVAAHCPKSCSGHGSCNSEEVCTCNTGFNGPDCSRRDCPSSLTWVGKITYNNAIHTNETTECGNMGLCNSKTGQCECFPGFGGVGCQRLTCPNDCNGVGSCELMSRIALEQGLDTAHGTGGDGVGIAYTNWETDAVMGCVCDPGRAAADCSARLCPMGDNPQTTGQQQRAVYLNITNDGLNPIWGSVRINFAGHRSAPFMANADQMSADSCANVFESLENVKSAHCYQDRNGPYGSAMYTIRMEFENANTQNNLFRHDGNPPISMFTCDKSNTTDPTLVDCMFGDVDVLTLNLQGAYRASVDGDIEVRIFNDTSNPNTYQIRRGGLEWGNETAITGNYQPVGGTAAEIKFESLIGHTQYAEWTLRGTASDDSVNVTVNPTYREHDVCSQSGVCNLADGKCTCGAGHTGAACEQFSFVVSTQSDPVLLAKTEDLSYSGSILRVESTRANNAGYNMITVVENSNTVFQVHSNGLTEMSRISVTNDFTQNAMTVTGGQTVTNGGLVVNDPGVTLASGDLIIANGTAKIDHNVTDISLLHLHGISQGYASTMLLLEAATPVTTDYKFLDFTAGGSSVLDVSGTGKLTAVTGGIATSAVGATLSGGLQIPDTGATITGTTMVNGASTTATVQAVQQTGASFTGTVFEATTQTQTSATTFNIMKLGTATGDMVTFRGDGKTTIAQGGFVVTAGGATVTAGGMHVSGGEEVAGGLTVSAGGATLTGGLAVDTLGATILTAQTATQSLLVDATSGVYTGTAAQVRVPNTASASTYSLLSLDAGGTQMFEVRGDGRVKAEETLYRNFVILAINAYALTVAETGSVVLASGNNFGVTLPITDASTDTGYRYTIVQSDTTTVRHIIVAVPGGAASSVRIFGSSIGGSTIAVHTFPGTADKGIESTAANGVLGDFVTLVSGGSNVWYVVAAAGHWNTEA